MLFFFSLLLFISSCLSSQYVGLTIYKPTPCHRVESYEVFRKVLRVYLTEGSGLCTQVITEEKLSIPSHLLKDVSFIEIYSGGKLWKRIKLGK